jgi:hypothetical protein
MTPDYSAGQVPPNADAQRPASAVPATKDAGIPPLPPHTQVPLRCRHCGALGVPVVTPGTGQHAYRADCASCGAYIQFISQYTPEERARRRQQAPMKRQPATPDQLHYLGVLGDRGPLPASKLEASQRIDSLIHQRKGA